MQLKNLHNHQDKQTGVPLVFSRKHNSILDEFTLWCRSDMMCRQRMQTSMVAYRRRRVRGMRVKGIEVSLFAMVLWIWMKG